MLSLLALVSLKQCKDLAGWMVHVGVLHVGVLYLEKKNHR